MKAHSSNFYNSRKNLYQFIYTSFFFVCICRKNFNDLGISNRVPEDDEASQIESTAAEDQESNSSPSSIPNSSQPFEEVRQDLETFSIGLSKKSSELTAIF